MQRLTRYKLPKRLSKIYSIQKEYYLKKLAEHGLNSAAAVSWNSQASQYCRFIVLAELFLRQPTDFSLLDVGCGLGDFFYFLIKDQHFEAKYTGIDFLPEMIATAQQKYPGVKFFMADFSVPEFKDSFDYIVCSGALNILIKPTPAEHLEHIKNFIKKMYALCHVGAGFNLLSIGGRNYFEEDSRFYYADEQEILSFCRSFCPNTEIINDYLPHDLRYLCEKHDVVKYNRNNW